jgi:sugar/nucleoside kinase (ribokinase family)
MNIEVLIVGHISKDNIKLPQYFYRDIMGGTSTYVSLGSRMLDANVSIISKVGRDFPPIFLDTLIRNNINTSMLIKDKNAYTTSFVLDYTENGKRQLFLRNKGPLIKVEDIPNSIKSKAVHIAPIVNEIDIKAINKLKEIGIVSIDPQGFVRQFDEEGRMHLVGIKDLNIINDIDILKLSKRETEIITNENDLTKSIKILNRLGIKNIIVTKGAYGAFFYLKNKIYFIPTAKPRQVIDTTGAGDVFIGSFLAEYIRGKDPLWCACVGSSASSFIIEEVGPRGITNKKNIYERAKQVYEKTSIIDNI